MARKKLILVYNPRSSHAREIEREAVAKMRQVKGLMVGKFEVSMKRTIPENAALLAKMLDDGDLVVSAGGDGTAAMAVNGVLLSGKKVIFASLKYGNFNDFSRMLCVSDLSAIVVRYQQKKITQIYPLDINIDNKHWRFAPCYATLGLFAESTQIFEDPAVRAKLKKQAYNLGFSIRNLAKWYFGNRKREFLPKNTKINGQKIAPATTDILAVNSRTVARVMRGGEWAKNPNKFWLATGKLGGFGGLILFMIKSIIRRIPGNEVSECHIKFEQPTNILIHAEGEVEQMTQVTDIKIQKSETPLRVVDFMSK